MAFTSEAVARLRLDSSAFERGLTSTVASIGNFGAKANGEFSKKFSLGSAIKDSMKGLGMASIGGVVGTITDYFSRQADKAREIESLTAGSAENLRNTLATIGGVQRKLELNQKAYKDLGVDIELTAKTLADLESNPQDLFNPMWKAETDKVRATLNDLKAKQDALGNANTLLARDIEYQNALYDNQLALLEQIEALDDRGATELEKARAGLDSLESAKRLAVIHQRDEETIRSTTLQMLKQNSVVIEMERAARQSKRDARDTIAGMAARGRTGPNGQRQPMSEVERIAARGEDYQQKAQDAVLTGAKFDAARYTELARADRQTVTDKIRASSSLVKPEGDSSMLKQLTDANGYLQRIDRSLTVVQVGK